MKISILTPDLSHNCLGRAHLLAKILQRRYEVEIVGPVFGDGIWQPLADDESVTYKCVNLAGRIRSYRLIRPLLRKITGDVIYASKPLFSSYDIGLLKRWLSNKPLVLDIDDWQLGFLIKDCTCPGDMSRSLRKHSFLSSLTGFLFCSNMSYWWTALNEKLARLADQVTVSNSFLREKFGGTILWHARDTAAFDPSNFDRDSLRRKYGVEGSKRTVTFCGTPRRHKGVEDLVMALKQVPEAALTVVGMNEKEYCKELVRTAQRELGSERVHVFGYLPFSKIPEFLAMSDIIAIPQRKGYATIGQVPAKVFDAMAMAKPIIATNVSDLPEILGDCGWLVEPEQPTALADAIRYVLEHSEEAKEKGQKARELCKAKYSYDATEEVLCGLFKKYE